MNLADATLLRFIMVGVGNTLVGLLVIYVAKIIGVGDWTANAIGYGVGFGLGFFLNKQWTFRYNGSSAKAFVRYFGVMLTAYAANLLAVYIAINLCSINSYIGQALGVPVFASVNYIGGRLYVFAQHGLSRRSRRHDEHLLY